MRLRTTRRGLMARLTKFALRCCSSLPRLLNQRPRLRTPRTWSEASTEFCSAI